MQTQIYSFTLEDTDIPKTGELNITQQKGFKLTVIVLRQFTNLLSKTITAWETFKDGEIRHFYVPHTNDLAESSWGTHLAAIDKDVSELRDFWGSLQHQTEQFENMTNSLVTHAQVSSTRGDDYKTGAKQIHPSAYCYHYSKFPILLTEHDSKFEYSESGPPSAMK